jgi:hypothetical protein
MQIRRLSIRVVFEFRIDTLNIICYQYFPPFCLENDTSEQDTSESDYMHLFCVN